MRVRNKPSLISLRCRFGGGNKNFIQKKGEKCKITNNKSITYKQCYIVQLVILNNNHSAIHLSYLFIISIIWVSVRKISMPLLYYLFSVDLKDVLMEFL